MPKFKVIIPVEVNQHICEILVYAVEPRYIEVQGTSSIVIAARRSQFIKEGFSLWPLTTIDGNVG